MKRFLTIVAFLCLPLLVFASQEHHGGEAHVGHGGIPWTTLLLSTINLFIFFGVLKRFAWPAIRNAVFERQQQVIKTIAEATKAKQEAEQIKAECERRLANLGGELEEMRRQARAEIARERDQILASAEKLAITIRRDAERAAEQEVRTAQTMLREEVARQALEIARELAAQRLTPTSQDQSIAEFLTKVQA